MAFAAKNDGNTSIMDIASGFKKKKGKNNNRSMMRMETLKSKDTSDKKLTPTLPNLNMQKVKSQSNRLNNMANSQRVNKHNTSFISDDNILDGSSDSCEIIKQNSGSDMSDVSDEDDCEIMPGDGDSDTSFTERLQGYKRPHSTALEQVKNEKQMVVRETEKE